MIFDKNILSCHKPSQYILHVYWKIIWFHGRLNFPVFAHDLQPITDTRVVNRKVSGVNTTDIQNVVRNKLFCQGQVKDYQKRLEIGDCDTEDFQISLL